MMTWIKTIEYSAAEGPLKALYDQVKGPDNNVDNIMLAHSLRPHTMKGHMTLYKYTLHHSNNTVNKWFLECIGVYVSMLNQCSYCVEHHFSGMTRLLNNEKKANNIKSELLNFECKYLNEKEIQALKYANQLTLKPTDVSLDLINNLRQVGWEDGEILEINQVVAYFNYANRTVLGLGVQLAGDVIGLSPNNSADLDDWNHQ